GDLAFAIGVGYLFPVTLQTPNITSVRVRLPSGLTLEPQLVLASISSDLDNGGGMTINDKQNQVTLASLVHIPVRSHGRVDFELLGAASVSNQTSDPNGPDNTRTITTIAASYGIGIAYWLSPHWNLSFSGTNPVIQYLRNKNETGPGTSTTNKTTTIGLVFDPQVALMIHLYN